MSDYRVAIGGSAYSNVTIGGRKRYDVGVSYEIPSKSIQYTNEIIEDFSNLFNGIRTSFDVVVEGESYIPLNEQQLIIAINDNILKPVTDYLVSGDQIFFTNPPPAGAKFSGVACATTADLTRTINYVVESGSINMEPGIKGHITLDVTGTIDSWTLITDQPGFLLLDIKKSTYANYPNMTSIAGTEKPYVGIVNGPYESKRKDDDLSTWNRVLNAGDILQYEVIGVTNVKRFLIALKLHL